MKSVLQLIDSLDYISTNCFQHQLAFTLRQVCNVTYLPMQAVSNSQLNPEDFDVVLSTLKQRTLYKNIDTLSTYLKNVPVVVYDQDPWESFRDDSPYKGSYEAISDKINVSFFAVTTKWWADFITEQCLPSKFVRMWVVPDYCDSCSEYGNRKINVGFIGSVHPYRKRLFDFLQDKGTNVEILGSRNYRSFLNVLGTMRIFIHSEDVVISVNEKPINLGTGLWIKDVEAAARGAFSIRNRQEGSETYLKGIETVKLYDSMEEVPAILEGIKNLKSHDRQEMINRSVKFIKESNLWNETVTILTS